MPAADYDVTLRTEGIESVRDLIDPERLGRDLSLMHRKLVFMSLAHAIRTCSVDTGRARAGFLALFRKHGVSADSAMRRPPPGGSAGHPDPRSIAEGTAKGRVLVDRPFHVEIANAVEYVEYINTGTSRMRGTAFLERTMLKTREHADKVVAWYVGQALAGNLRATDDPSQGPGEIPT